MMYTRVNMLGVNLDIDPIDLPPEVWTETANMVARPGAMHRARGYQEVFATPLFAPYYLQYSPQLGEPHWIYAGTNNIGHINEAGAHADITPASLTVPVDENGWTGGNLNGLAVINALENEPYYWFEGIGATALALPGQRANTRYRVMRPFKYHLIGLGVTDDNGDFRDQVHWSDAADPGSIPATWVPAPDNEAGDNILADENGDIIDGLALRDSFYIYKQDSVYEMVYVGGNAVFRFRKVFGSTGVLTRNCIVRVKGTHVVLGNGDIYQHDGQNVSSIVDGVVRDSFFSTIDDASYQNSFAVYVEALEQVWFCVPTTGNTRPNLALVWDTVTRQWGYREIPDADFAAPGIIADLASGGPEQEQWDNDSGIWNTDSTRWLDQTLDVTEDALLIADASQSKLFRGNTGTQADGEAYRSTVGRLGLNLQEPREKAIRRIWPRINAVADTAFTMELFNQRDPMSGLEQVGVYQFVPNTEGVPVNVNARYLGIRIYTDDSVDWDIAGLDIEYLPRGKF